MKKTKPAKATKQGKFYACGLKQLPDSLQHKAAYEAIERNPTNRPPLGTLMAVAGVMPTTVGPLSAVPKLTSLEDIKPAHLAVLISKYWGDGGVKLTVSFVEKTVPALQEKILSHMNAWNQYCNVLFTLTDSQGQVRISRGRGGYWSYLGTDVLQISKGQQTMNLEGFTLNTPDSEYARVVRHETGHTLGFPHEHLRKQIINRLDTEKTISYFMQTQGWTREDVIQQVLVPLEDNQLMATEVAEETSVMTYQLPAAITKNGVAIAGGTDITKMDADFAAKIYPKAPVIQPPVTPPTGPQTTRVILEITGDVKSVKIVG